MIKYDIEREKGTRRRAIMKTLIFAYDLNSEQSKEALYGDREQRLYFMCTYKIRKRQRAVCDIDRCLL